MLWTGLACLDLFINSVIWTGNTINWAPVWCDICEPRSLDIVSDASLKFSTASKFIIGVSVAIPAASLCINRRLYHISCVRVVSPTKFDKRRAMMVDLAIGVGIPVLVMALRMFLLYPPLRYSRFPDVYTCRLYRSRSSIQYF